MSDGLGETIRVRVDEANPGQFFACCGMLELAARVWGSAEGWFARGDFNIGLALDVSGVKPDLSTLLSEAGRAPLLQEDPSDEAASPLTLGGPFGMRLDWWADTRAGGKAFKVWAGRMSGFRIARAAQVALLDPSLHDESLFDRGGVLRDVDQPDKKVEPFPFDSRRGASSLPLDIGFAPDPLKMETFAHPAVEFLCLVGLQRFRPMPTEERRVFDYQAWAQPLGPGTASAAVCGLLPAAAGRTWQFEVVFRTDQKKHKAFAPARPRERSIR